MIISFEHHVGTQSFEFGSILDFRFSDLGCSTYTSIYVRATVSAVELQGAFISLSTLYISVISRLCYQNHYFCQKIAHFKSQAIQKCSKNKCSHIAPHRNSQVKIISRIYLWGERSINRYKIALKKKRLHYTYYFKLKSC